MITNSNEKFNEIYVKYWRLVTKVANNVIRDYHLSQDICQEVFIALYDKAENLDEELLKYWLIVNAKRKAIDFCRKAYRKHEVVGTEFLDDSELKVDPDWRPSHVACDMDKALIESELVDEIMEMLESHNENWHDILKRSFVEEEDAKEIAEELGITVENVRTRLHRAKKWVRNEFQAEYEGL